MPAGAQSLRDPEEARDLLIIAQIPHRSAVIFPEPLREAPEDSGLPLLAAEHHEEHREPRKDRGEEPSGLVDAVGERAEDAVDLPVAARDLVKMRERELPQTLYEP